MKKVLVIVCAFLMAFQMLAFAECSVSVTEKSTSGATVNISGAEEAAAVGIWADYDNAGNMIGYQPADVTFADGAATLSYTGSFTNLKFMLVKDLVNIQPLCDATEIELGDIVFDEDEGIEDLGDVN